MLYNKKWPKANLDINGFSYEIVPESNTQCLQEVMINVCVCVCVPTKPYPRRTSMVNIRGTRIGITSLRITS